MPLPPAPSTRVPITDVDLEDTHRLIPAKYSRSGTVLSRLTDNEQMLDELLEIDGATNDRLLGEEGLLPGIGVHELVYGVDYAHIVNAAFTHAAPDGGRFNSSERGAWYAGLRTRNFARRSRLPQATATRRSRLARRRDRHF